MSEHPIQGLMQTAMENIKEMVDVNTIVGEPVQTPDGSVIMPISKVGFGFAAGGSEFLGTEEQGGNRSSGDKYASDRSHDDSSSSDSTHRSKNAHNASVQLPFGGGSGGGVSITPIAFLVVGAQGVKVVPLDNQTHLFERLIDAAPQWVDRLQSMFSRSDTGDQTHAIRPSSSDKLM
ncbi:spore germination protein GerW family protein [Cohnella lubricantis]|uniref:Sporulation protein YtfJ n=1 Tax=Cohnella lubricantis TaxID=2163172 RepID=A0A841T9R4_9BACL|nr:spore germination protein GerW family protein [Cohnella lubricantis]MBB6677702.1 sporulation protein YtfJ [Cohnella lubricantis]MBP2117664.1 putative spore protein YtfJ [Cohnella lubricantis]